MSLVREGFWLFGSRFLDDWFGGMIVGIVL
jgi:hypothetical protein